MFYQLSIENRFANDKIKVNFILKKKLAKKKFQVKLSTRKEIFSMIFIDDETIAFIYSEQSIWIWDLKTEDNVTLLLDLEKGFELNDQIISINYSSKKSFFHLLKF